MPSIPFGPCSPCSPLSPLSPFSPFNDNLCDSSYTFQTGDVVRLNVFKAKDCGCVELRKDVVVEEECEAVDIALTTEDTTIGEIINKPTKYWYEVTLNPETIEQTIIGYDLDGAKEFILYPEANESE